METQEPGKIVKKTVKDLLVAGCRMKGKYEDIGVGLKKLGKLVGFRIAGKPMTLYYDCAYKEEDADFEPCFPVRRAVEKEGVNSRVLKGGEALSIIHKGSYESLCDTYKIIGDYVKEQNLEVIIPSRELYIKGPGLIFKGNPDNYLSEIQFFLKTE